MIRILKNNKIKALLLVIIAFFTGCILTIGLFRFLGSISASDLILNPVETEWLPNKCISTDNEQIIDCDNAGIFTIEIHMDNKHDSAFREIYQQGEKYLLLIAVDDRESKMGEGHLYLASNGKSPNRILEKEIKVNIDFQKQEIEIRDYDLTKYLDTPYQNVETVKLDGVYRFKTKSQT